MKKLLSTLLISLLVMIMLTHCATFTANLNTEKLLTQYAVMKVVEADKANILTRAAKIKEIASEAKSIFDNGTATVDVLADALNARVAKLNLSPSDQLLASALIQTVVADLQAKQATDQSRAQLVYQVSTVLGWVNDAAGFYK